MQCWVSNPSSSFRERSLSPRERMCWDNSSRREAAARREVGESVAGMVRFGRVCWWAVKWVWMRVFIDSVGSIVILVIVVVLASMDLCHDLRVHFDMVLLFCLLFPFAYLYCGSDPALCLARGYQRPEFESHHLCPIVE